MSRDVTVSHVVDTAEVQCRCIYARSAQIINRYSQHHSAYTSGTVSVFLYATISVMLFGSMTLALIDTVTVRLLALR
jgi:hypothetical protein